MNSKDFSRILVNKLLTSFDIEKDVDIEGMNFDFIGKYNEKITRYFAFRELTYESFENNETILCKSYPEKITRGDVEDLKGFIRESCSLLAPPRPNHMSTCLTLIVISKLEDSEPEYIKKFRFYRSYAFGFKGWVNCKLICVDPERERVLTNREGRKELKFIQNILSS